MKLIRDLVCLTLLIVAIGCSDDDGEQVAAPILTVEATDAIKPDSTTNIQVSVTAPGLLATDGITGEIASGDGILNRISISGENTASGNAEFEFQAGSMENTTALISFAAIDQAGREGTAEVEISITSLDVKEVIILNEGNFFSANGSLDLYDIKEQEVTNSVYPASATVQRAVQHQDKIYLVTNAPDRLDILNAAMESEDVIDQGLDNPIDFAAIGNTGYVSNWGDINTAFGDNPDSFIAVVDLETNTIIDSVMLSVRPQNMLAYDDQLYIAMEGGTSVSVLDPDTQILTEIPVAAGPSELVVDEIGTIWVLCTSGALVGFNSDDFSVVTTIDGLTTGGFNEKMAINGNGNSLYFLGGTNNTFTGLTTVYEVDLSDESVTPLIENGFALYGIGVNPESNEIYIGDSNAFQSTGTGFRYDSEGNKLDEFATGIGPKDFLFK